MKLIIKKLKATDFKGIRNAEYGFGEKTRVSGMNGLGKSTIMTMWTWLFTDKDSELKSNPDIIPLGVEECTPRVEAVLDIDGVEVTIAKQQKITTSKPNERGVSKRTLSNVYEINSVPKTERDFKADLEDKGLDFELFLPLSHPDVFTGQKAADMRKVLFKMATDKTDLDIALLGEETEDVANLLESYKFDEIEAMNKASKKKAEEQVKAIPNQIIGLEKAKVNTDTAELELAVNSLQEQISEKEKLLEDNQSALSEHQKYTDGILELKFKMSDIERTATESLESQKKEIRAKIDETDRKFQEATNKQGLAEIQLEQIKDVIVCFKKERENVGVEYHRQKDMMFDESRWVFDESSTVCPMCSREYENAKVEEIKEQFEVNKSKAKESFELDKRTAMQKAINDGNRIKASEEKAVEDLAVAESEIVQCKEQKMKVNGEKTEAMKELDTLPHVADLSDNQEYESLRLQVFNMEKSLLAMNSSSSYRDALNSEIKQLRTELTETQGKIAESNNNVRIDDQIAELQTSQRDYEQAKADAEKILYQLSIVSAKKNELLVEDINKNFKIVTWKLFEYQKNGNYKEVCVPQIDDKSFGISTNTGREIIAKLDIVNSLQKFFGMNVPVFLDGAESLNDFNLPCMNCQLITLKVTVDKELKVEVEN